MKILKTYILPGFIIWLIPFVIGMLFYSKEGQLTIDIFLFKSIMIVLSCIVGCFFLIRFFNQVSGEFIRFGIIAGLSWLIINWALDFIILIPMSKISLVDYITQIGIRYLVLPVISFSMGLMLEGVQSK